MSAILKRNKHSNSFFEDQSVASMHFWGICCESGKRYAQVVGQRFRMTMAVLDPKSFCKEEKIVSLVVIRDDIEYLLCVLKHGELHQVNLNLIFDTGENVIFYINGYGRVYLSGYQLTDSIAEVLADENGYLCPLVELKSKGKKESIESVDVEASTSRNKKGKKELLMEDGDPDLWRKEIASQGDENGDEDEEDSDFSASDLPETESDEIESEEMDDDLSDVVSDEIDEDDLDEDERELIMASQKRKRRTALQALKRQKTESMNSSDYVENEDVIYVKDEDPDVSMSSPGVKVQNEPASSEKKKKKKKKKITEISQIADNAEVNEEKSSKKKVKMPVQKLEGGLEIQDVVIGNGPVASKGKMVHVFYVGRFENKTIFDARTPGKKPFSFKLGAGQVIKGWDVGLQGMKVGGQRKLKVPPNMAYGNLRNSGIPPNSTLYFTVELQNVS